MDERGRFSDFAMSRSDQLLRTAYLITGDQALASELLTNTLARTSIAWRSIRSTDSVDVYVLRTLIEADARRRRWDRLMRRPTTGANNSSSGVEASDDDAVWSALSTLQPRSRAGVVLRCQLDLTDAAIADVLGDPISGVERRLSTALARLGSGDSAEVRRCLDRRAASLTPAIDPAANDDVRWLVGRLRQRRRAAGAAIGVAVLLGAAVVVPLLTKNTSPAVSAPVGPLSAAAIAPGIPPGPPPPGFAATAPGQAVAVYYLGDTGSTIALYREFRRTTARDRVRAAVELMLAPPLDAGYRTLWPTGTKVNKLTVDGDVASVDLSAAALAGGVSNSYSCLSLQQLVWTVTAADASIGRVTVSVEGRGEGIMSNWWGVDCGRDAPLSRAPAPQVLAPVQIFTHNDGDPVRSRFSFGGEAAVAGGALSWAVIDRAGTVLAAGESKPAGSGDRGLWQAIVVLDGVKRGDVVQLRAWETVTSGGAITNLDTKTVTISG